MANQNIRVNDEERVAIARRITSIADDTTRELTEGLETVLETIDEVWKGKAADKFKIKFTEDNKSICRQINELCALINEQLVRVVRNAEEVDEEVAEKIN